MNNIYDILNSFLLEYKKETSKNDIAQYENSINEYVNDKSIVDIRSINPSMYVNYIDKSMNSLKDISVDSERLDEFFSNVYKSAYIDGKKITLPLQDSDEIEKIRPEYLSSIVTEYNNAVKAVLSDKLTFEGITKKYVYGDFFKKIKKSCVKTSISVNDNKDLMKLSSPNLVIVNSVFLQSSVIPFFRSYEQNVNDLSVIAINLKGKINSTYNDLITSIEAVRTMIDTEKVDKEIARNLMYLSINFMRSYMDICAYVTGMLIQKIGFYTFNNTAYTTLYNMIYNYFPEGELILHESAYIDINDVDDSELLQSILSDDASIVVPHIQQLVGKTKMELANLIAKKYNYNINYDQDLSETGNYDAVPYVRTVNMIKDIAHNIIAFHDAYKLDEVVDDIIESCGLSETFISKYQDKLSTIPDTSYYTIKIDNKDISDSDKSPEFMSLYNDVVNFEKNLSIISGNMRKVYAYLIDFKKSIDINVDNIDDNRYNEIKSFVDKLIIRFKEFALQVMKKLLSRLENLTAIIDNFDLNEDWSIPEEYVPWDYSLESYLEAYNDIELCEKEIIEEMTREFISKKEFKERGVKVVFEDTTPVQNNDNKTAPQVQTDAANQQPQTNNTNTTNNTQQNNNQNNNGTTQQSENLLQKFANFIEKILSAFRSKVAKLTNTNNKWLASVKAGILNLDYSNTNITAAEYPDLTGERITNDIQAAVNKINSLNVNNLPKELSNHDNACYYFFNTIPKNIPNTTSFIDRVKRFFTYGKSGKNDMVSYTSEDAKNKVTEMFNYCEGYDNMNHQVENDIKKLSDAAKKKQQEILNNSRKPMNESVMLEADANKTATTLNNTQAKVNNQNADDGKINASTMITSVVREYSGAILTVVEKKYLDYMKVLNKLSPNNNGAETKSGENTETPENENK